MDQKQITETIKKGLLATPKYLPTWYLYDDIGSVLFAHVASHSPYFYCHSSEMTTIKSYVEDMLDFVTYPCALVDIGSGNALKTRHFIDGLLKRQNDLQYLPIDISQDFLFETCQSLNDEYGSELKITPIPAKFEDGIETMSGVTGNKLILCLNVLLNFSYTEQLLYLSLIAGKMTEDDVLVISMDITADETSITNAYMDPLGIIKKFFLNIMSRLNKDMKSELNTDAFDAKVEYLKNTSRDSVSYIKLWTESSKPQSVYMPEIDMTIDFEANERVYIHDDNFEGFSCKYTTEQIRVMAKESGLAVVKMWMDPDKHTAVCCLKKSQACALKYNGRRVH